MVFDPQQYRSGDINRAVSAGDNTYGYGKGKRVNAGPPRKYRMMLAMNTAPEGGSAESGLDRYWRLTIAPSQLPSFAAYLADAVEHQNFVVIEADDR